MEVLGRYAGPATWVLSSLAEGPKHGYAPINDIEGFAGVRLQPGTFTRRSRGWSRAASSSPGPDGRASPTG